MIIDTHSHLYSKDFDNDRKEVILRAIDCGVEKMIIPGTKPEDSVSILELCKEFPTFCFPALAVHPEDLAEDFQSQLKMLEMRIKQLEETFEESLHDRNEIDEDTRFRLEQIEEALAEMRADIKHLSKNGNPGRTTIKGFKKE